MRNILAISICGALIILVSGCGNGTPNFKLLCNSGESEVTFETVAASNSLIGDDGTTTKFYQSDLFEIVFINFDESSNPIRIVKYYPTDTGIEVIENNVSTSWRCKDVS